MGEITIRLRYNVQTGKKDIFIGYESEEDMTGYEHEQQHKQIVRDLIRKGVLDSGEAGDIVVERVRPGQTARPAAPRTTPALTVTQETEKN